MAVNVFDIAGTWRRGLSEPGALTGSLSVDTETGRVNGFTLLRTGGIKEGTGYTVYVGSGPRLLGGTPLSDTVYGLDSITFQGIRNGQYRIETALRGGYSMVATWHLPTGSLSSYAGGPVTFAFTSSAAYAMANPGSGVLTPSHRAPVDVLLSASTIPENSLPGTTVGRLSTIDPNPGDTFTYSLVSGDGDVDNAAFQIVGHELQSNAPLDFEVKDRYSILVRSTDRKGLTKDKPFTITVTDVNEAPTGLTIMPVHSSLDENVDTTGRIKVADIVVADDALGTNSLSLVGADADTFEIDGQAIYLRSGSQLDYEARRRYAVTVTVEDATVVGSTPQTAEFTLDVTNVNEPPRDIVLPFGVLPENTPLGTVIGRFSTIDPDAGDTFTYALVAGFGDVDNASFVIVGDELRLNTTLDFERKSAYSIRIRSTDSGTPGLTIEKTCMVFVKDVNEAPTDVVLSRSTIPENQPLGTLIGRLSTIDQDAGDAFTYSFVSGPGAADNAAFRIVGDELRSNAVFNFERRNCYTILVRSTDRGDLFKDKKFTIRVTDVNEAPTSILLSKSTIPENRPAGTLVGVFSTLDPDFCETFRYSLVPGKGGADNASFQVVGNQLRSNAAFNFEARNTYSIRVRSSDRGGLPTERSFTIRVLDVNEAPTALNVVPATSALPENTDTTNRIKVADLVVADDALGRNVLSLGGVDAATFEISGTALYLRAGVQLDHEARPRHTVLITVQDATVAGSVPRTATFSLDVTNVNEGPTVVVLSQGTIVENSPVGAVIGRLSTSDPDAGDTFTYTLIAGDGDDDNASFHIIGDELRSSEVFDFEARREYTVRVRSTDSGTPGLWIEKRLVVTVLDDPADDVVPKGFLPGVPEQVRRDAWAVYRDDSRIDRNEMISLLRKTGESDGVVTGPEVAGLRRIVAGRIGNGWELTMDDHVRSLARKVVGPYTDPVSWSVSANGATADEMSAIVAKWFEGRDLPSTLTSGNPTAAAYEVASGSLFADGSIGSTDVRQGRVADCYFLTALAGVADTAPDSIRDMFIDNGDGTWTVGFYDPDSRGSDTIRDYVTVDRRLPTDALGTFVFASIGDRFDAAGNKLWVALAEKAYAQWAETGALKTSTGKVANSYGAIEWGYANHAVFHMTGAWPTVIGTTSKGLPQDAQGRLDEALDNGHMVMLATRGETKPNGSPRDGTDAPFAPAHVYLASIAGSAGPGMYRLLDCRDPAATRELVVSWDQLAANVDSMMITGTRGSASTREFFTLEGKYAGWKPDSRSGDAGADKVVTVRLQPLMPSVVASPIQIPRQP